MKPGKKRLRGCLSLSVTVVLIAVFCPSSAHAQQGFGVRGGVSAEPEQFYFGGHGTFGPVVEKLWFRPNLEVGVGNGVTLVALNAEFTYWVPLRKNPWNVYLGGGAERVSEAERETAAGRGGTGQESATADLRCRGHGRPLMPWQPYGSPRAPADRCRSGRCS